MNNGVSKSNTHQSAPAPLVYQHQAEQLKPIAVNPLAPAWCETVVITPRLAEEWLKANARNRQPRKSRIKVYARDMAAGRWQFSTQGITFGSDGSLLDGQHRLHAVIAAGIPVAMIVWFNVPPAARSVIDIGAPRTFSDVSELSKRQAAVTIAMMRGMSGMKTSAVTMADKIAFYRRHGQTIDKVISLFVTGRSRSGFDQATVVGAVARASLHMTESDIGHFCTVLQSGIPTDDPRDVTVIKLRDRLMQGFAGAGGSVTVTLMYSLAAAALKAFNEGRSLSKLVPLSNDPFPLPETTEE